MRDVSSPTHRQLPEAGDPAEVASAVEKQDAVLCHSESARPRFERLRVLGNRLRWVPDSLRTRILAWFIGLLVLATVLFVGVTYTVLVVRLDQRIDAELRQERAELELLAQGDDPATGERFGTNVRRIFDVFLDRNVPSREEALITLVDGEPYERTGLVTPYRLDADPEILARWRGLTRPDRSSVDTPAGRVEYLAVPLVTPRGRTEGVFVAAIFRDRLREDYVETVQAAGAVGIAVLLVGSLLAWRLAGRVVGPVTGLTSTARSISETDLSRRIDVDGRDEVAQLASTFNEMLDRLERAFESQRQFLDDAGHELRTPLAIVSGNIELLEEDPHRKETIALVIDELERMGRIVDDLLVLANREEPDFLELSTVNVGVLTDELASKAAALDSVEWVVESRGRGVIVADRQRLTQAVLQLAENAVRHAGDAGPITLGSSVANGEARLWVRDRGRGIPAEDQDLIFGRFRRGRSGVRAEGSGLGLAIVKAVAEAHHGRVELASTPGKGSTFTIVVPVDQPQEAV
jgi:two-component system OmpR family sensor kinase